MFYEETKDKREKWRSWWWLLLLYLSLATFFQILFGSFFSTFQMFVDSIAYLWSTSLLLETLNSSVNVIIYAVFNKKFRILFVEMFCSCFRRKQQLKGPVRSSGRFTLGPLIYGPVPSPSPSPFATSSTPSSRSSSKESVRFTF